MKRFLMVMLALTLLTASGCKKNTDDGVMEPVATESKKEVKNTISISDEMNIQKDWTIMGEYEFDVTGDGSDDRIILATSAQNDDGEMMWDDVQDWTLTVVSADGAYNLYSKKISGAMYFEVNEVYIKDDSVPAISAYIFSGSDREIRNYVFRDGVFEEDVEYAASGKFGGEINSMYSTIPECVMK